MHTSTTAGLVLTVQTAGRRTTFSAFAKVAASMRVETAERCRSTAK